MDSQSPTPAEIAALRAAAEGIGIGPTDKIVLHAGRIELWHHDGRNYFAKEVTQGVADYLDKACNLAHRLADALEAAQANAEQWTAFVEALLATEPHIDGPQPITEALLDKVKEVSRLADRCDRLTAALREAKTALETCIRQIDRCQDYHKGKYAAEVAIATINAALTKGAADA